MEVHHHPHAAKKKFKEYFLEFIMIFLAVTLGFIAESWRENITDRAKEKEFMRSMVQDLKNDTATLNRSIDVYSHICKETDTLLMCLKSDNPDPEIVNQLVFKDFWRYNGYSYNNRTIQELKNAGNFRLITNSTVADSISDYDNYMNAFVLNQYNDLKNTMFAFKNVETKVVPYKEINKSWLKGISTFGYDSSDFLGTDKYTFISHDKELLSQYYNQVFIHYSLCLLFSQVLKNADNRAQRLIQFLQKEYHLE